ncbi:MAG: redoxin domain-containing protein [Gammaproteobacteria bacterium]|nr:redoxin domain-containing protein [Gammaproteobacteria bacterium]
MINTRNLAKVLGVALLATGLSSAAMAQRVSDFSLIDHYGKFHQVSRYADHDALVLFSYDKDSEVVEDALRDFNRVIERFAEEDIAFFMIESTGIADKAVITAAAAEDEIEIPVLVDDTQTVSELLGVTRSAQVIVIDPASREIVYNGSLNDRFTEGSSRRRARDHYLREVLETVVEGGEVSLAGQPSSGEAIVFGTRDQHATAGLDYATDIVPIVERRCVSCHQDGGIAPFAMDSHQMLQGWSPMIREVLMTKRMPPAQIDPDYIHLFQDQSYITIEETQTLLHWIEGGSANTSGSDPLAAIEHHAPEWELSERWGEPDMVVQIPAQEIPATGVIDYRNIPLQLGNEEELWVKGVEFKPGDRQVLHHIIAFTFGGDGVNQFDILNQGIGMGAYAPGNAPNTFPEGTGYPLRANGGLLLQMHYTTSGKETVDASEIAIYLHDEKPTKTVLGGSAADLNIAIPAHADRHVMTASQVFPEDSYLTMLGPHMHYRGFDADFSVVYPDGREEKLLNVPNYQFNWQTTYDFKEPLLLPAGSELIFNATFDNSEMNPFNPDPTIEISWGEQTWQEMFFGFYQYYEADK